MTSRDKNTAAAWAMKRVIGKLIPRWKGVVYTAEAELEARNKATMEGNSSFLPWANIKFASFMRDGVKTDTSNGEYYRKFNEYGIPAVGEGMSLETLAKYKYHIDLGGGGGTTWSGTLEKLGLPGLLFHHVTPTKDYLHEKMIPWVHYVPVRPDLRDLKQKFEWAESHPRLVKKIADSATMLARSFGTPEGFQAMYDEFYEQPLHLVVEAYQPVASSNGGESWKEVIQRTLGDDLYPIMTCGGYYHHDCVSMVEGWRRSSQ